MHEYISAAQVAKLNDAISSAMLESVPDLSIRKLISYYGTNTACDRVYVFEIHEDGATTDNTYEWCEQGIEPQIRLLQNVPISRIAQDWLDKFRRHQAVVIRDMEQYRSINPQTYEFLKKQGIQRLICAPMYMDERLLGFIGIDNPVEQEMDEVVLTFRLLANFTAALIRHRDNDSSLRYLNERDALTGLNNLVAFRLKVKEALEKTDAPSYIAYFNISNFKNYNALYGLEGGDELLKKIASLMQEVFETEIACRSFSDHFLVFYQGQDILDRVQALHDKCLTLRRHFRVWLRAGICRTQIANAIYIDCDAAKTACDQLPDDNVSFVSVYSPEIMKNLQQEKYIQDNIASAVENGQILVYLQPVVRSLTGKLCSFEALARWDDPTYGFLSPGVFIPVLEKHHQCYHVDCYVIRECCRMLSERMAAGLPCVPVSFNISRTDFMMCNMVKAVKETAQEFGIDHRYLCVEITESAVMESPAEIKSAIREFKEAGFQVWMDDFGSAYSSLNTLKDYEFDEIKLDMAFMRSLNENSKIIVASAVQMAKRMGIHTLCEGVETQEQLQFLRDTGCEKIQGYFYGKPLPEADQLANLKEKGVAPETRTEADALDTIGLLIRDPDTNYAFVGAGNGRTEVVFASPAFRAAMQERAEADAAEEAGEAAGGPPDAKAETGEAAGGPPDAKDPTAAAGQQARPGTDGQWPAEAVGQRQQAQQGGDGQQPAEVRNRADIREVGRQLSNMVEEAARSGRETRGVIPIKGSTYFVTCREAADAGENRIVLVQAADVTEREKDSQYSYYLRCAAESYEEIYRYDDEQRELEVVKSLLEGETTGERVKLSESRIMQDVHPLDRKRFERFFDLENQLRLETALDKDAYTSVYRFRKDTAGAGEGLTEEGADTAGAALSEQKTDSANRQVEGAVPVGRADSADRQAEGADSSGRAEGVQPDSAVQENVYDWKAVTFLDISGPGEDEYLICIKASAVSDYNDAGQKADMQVGEKIPYGIRESGERSSEADASWDGFEAGNGFETDDGAEIELAESGGLRESGYAGRTDQLHTIRELRKEIFLDHLTGVHNRRFYDRVLKNRVVQAVAVIDIDNFSGINDVCGHSAGDQVLVDAAAAIRDTLRSTDIVVRYSGDEFLVAFMKINEQALARRLGEVVEKISGVAMSPSHPVSGGRGEETGSSAHISGGAGEHTSSSAHIPDGVGEGADSIVRVSASVGACYGSGLAGNMRETAEHNMHLSREKGTGHVTVTAYYTTG